MHCELYHQSGCTECIGLLQVAKAILENGYVKLAEAFHSAFPHLSYKTNSAKQKVLKMPLVALRVGNPAGGLSETYLIEHHPDVDYNTSLKLFSQLHEKEHTRQVGLSKQELHDLFKLTKSDRERECLRYVAWKASGLSASGARKHFGFETIAQRAENVCKCIDEIKAIVSDVEEMCKVQEAAALTSLCLTSSSDEEGVYCSELSVSESEIPSLAPPHSLPDDGILLRCLQRSSSNWFHFVSEIEEMYGVADLTVLEGVYNRLLPMLGSLEKKLVIHSHSAFVYVQNAEFPLQKRDADTLNGLIVSDSEVEDPDTYLPNPGVTVAEQKRALAQSRMVTLRRAARRRRAKLVAEKNFLGRKRGRKTNTILTTFPEIGQEIEKYVEGQSVGADAWRRTGILTFDGNSKSVEQKVTYDRIRQHLQDVYGRHFSYGTVVELCVARNRKRRSALRYKGVAQVTSRRARKGFQLKYNPDNHWSAALYKGLNFCQFTDGAQILNLNRDDAAGFRLDTLSTHRLHRSPMVRGKEILATHTDFVNSYPSILQTTSYHFHGTATTAELCAGVVKGAGVYPKNPAQHMSDFEMLEKSGELEAAFLNSSTKQPKYIECIRVDGASDEGPSHQEVQFWWTLRHLTKPTLVTLVTTRNSGASYLNRVELQNGCLSLAHSNLFIPSNLNGSCFDPETGKVDPDRLRQNMLVATQIYIDRVNNAPCGSTVIKLFCGADSSAHQALRSKVLTYLKGSKKKKSELLSQDPESFNFIKRVWDVCTKHQVNGLPVQYVFFLKCCHEVGCIHPLCSTQQPLPCEAKTWFPGGPSLSYFPLPVPDPTQPWGNAGCEKCKGVCHGHFLPPQNALMSSLLPMSKPPSEILKDAFNQLKERSPSDDLITEVAQKTLLSKEEVILWFNHLAEVQRNRKRGAEKAAATRRSKQQRDQSSQQNSRPQQENPGQVQRQQKEQLCMQDAPSPMSLAQATASLDCRVTTSPAGLQAVTLAQATASLDCRVTTSPAGLQAVTLAQATASLDCRVTTSPAGLQAVTLAQATASLDCRVTTSPAGLQAVTVAQATASLDCRVTTSPAGLQAVTLAQATASLDCRVTTSPAGLQAVTLAQATASLDCRVTTSPAGLQAVTLAQATTSLDCRVTTSQESLYLCRVCNKEYTDETELDEMESWIECDLCSEWFHFKCVNISSISVPEAFTCSDCSSV